MNNPPQIISADAPNKNLQITNTTKTGTAEFTKYHSSYNDAYNITKVMSDVKFKLYLKNGTDAIKVKLENGRYQPDENGTDITITTDTDGKISLENLTPNSYYLKEVEAPTGYKPNPNQYAFTVDSNGKTTYDDNITQIDNEEKLNKIPLTKQDENSEEIKNYADGSNTTIKVTTKQEGGATP